MGKNNEIVRCGGNGRRSTCVAYNGLVYVSGITSVDIKAGVRQQAEDIFSQLDKLLAANESHKNLVLSTQVTLQDMADFGDFNAVWDTWVSDGFEPARTITGGQLALPEYKVIVSLVAAQQP